VASAPAPRARTAKVEPQGIWPTPVVTNDLLSNTHHHTECLCKFKILKNATAIEQHRVTCPFQFFCCGVCHRIFASKSKLQLHQNKQHPNTPSTAFGPRRNRKAAKCGICKKVFGKRYDLRIHLRTHGAEKKEQCSFCGMKFADPATLRKHIKYQHARQGAVERPFVCRCCHKRFRWKHTLKAHLQTQHEDTDNVVAIKVAQRNVNGTEGRVNAVNAAPREELEFVRFHEEFEGRIRQWKDSGGRTFYDCTCNARKPARDLQKIKVHVMAHGKTSRVCGKCGREFENRYQLSAHMQIHQEGR